MNVIALPQGASHAVELTTAIEALRAGSTFLAAHDGQGCQRLFVLESADELLVSSRFGGESGRSPGPVLCPVVGRRPT